VRFRARQTISDVLFPPQRGNAFPCFLCQGLPVETTTQFSIRKSDDYQVLGNSEEFPNRLWPELFRDVLEHIDGNDALECSVSKRKVCDRGSDRSNWRVKSQQIRFREN